MCCFPPWRVARRASVVITKDLGGSGNDPLAIGFVAETWTEWDLPVRANISGGWDGSMKIIKNGAFNHRMEVRPIIETKGEKHHG